jgi:hypothetical protein
MGRNVCEDQCFEMRDMGRVEVRELILSAVSPRKGLVLGAFGKQLLDLLTSDIVQGEGG